MTEWPNDGGLSARHIRDACEASLRRLQTDHIDLYQMHHVDRNAPWDEVWQAMETLVDAGKGDLRRQQQLRRLAHRAGERSREGAPLPRSRERAEPLQPRVAHGRARSAARVSRVRPRRDPVEPARRRHARRHGHRRRAYARRKERATTSTANASAQELERWEKFCAELGEEPAAVARSRGSAPPKGRDRADHRPAHARAARRSVAARPRPHTRRRDAGHTHDEIFPGPGNRA